MADPRYFQIRGGANPHTRTEDDRLKEVDTSTAWKQWHAYVDALLDRGIDVYVAESGPDLTGMVFAANAGFLAGRLDDRPIADKTFYPSHFAVEHRTGESRRFAEFFQNFGVPVTDYNTSWDFEGEADAFPVGRGADLRWIFTWGYRTDPEVADWLSDDVVGEEMIRLELSDPRYYHGDTLLCDLGGPLLAYRGGLTEEARAELDSALGDRLVLLSGEDAADFIGNSFYVEVGEDRFLFAPSAISDETRQRVEACGVEVVPVDISEFFGKGGGGPKCMVFNLGDVSRKQEALDADVREFRERRHVESIRARNGFPH
jgi:N-dimethylarginine dimethylaminohydrolase